MEDEYEWESPGQDWGLDWDVSDDYERPIEVDEPYEDE